MILNLDTTGIVLSGHWNRMIFTPEWVGPNLFHEEILVTEIALVPGFPAIYRNNEVQFEASRQRLMVRPRVNTKQAFTRAEDIAVLAVSKLSSTPLHGVGINFSFIEKEPGPGLLELFNLRDSGAIAKTGVEVGGTQLVRALITEFGLMNLSLGYDSQKMTIDVNFHSDPNAGAGTDAVASLIARRAIENRILRLKEGCLHFLENIYDLRIEEGDGDGRN